jgi:hypothetical protein
MAIPKHDRTKPVIAAADIRNPRIALLLKAADERPAPDAYGQSVEDLALNVQDAVIALRHLGEGFHHSAVSLWENGDLFVSGLPVHPRDVAQALLARVSQRRFAYGKNGIIKPDEFEELKDHSAAVFDVYALHVLHDAALQQLENVDRLYQLAAGQEVVDHIQGSPDPKASRALPATPAEPSAAEATNSKLDTLIALMTKQQQPANPPAIVPPPPPTEEDKHGHKK